MHHTHGSSCEPSRVYSKDHGLEGQLKDLTKKLVFCSLTTLKSMILVSTLS